MYMDYEYRNVELCCYEEHIALQYRAQKATLKECDNGRKTMK